MIRLCAVAVVVLAVAGCGSTVTPEQATFACAHLSAAVVHGRGVIEPVSFTHRQVAEEYDLASPAAAQLVRVAVRDYCPQFAGLVP